MNLRPMEREFIWFFIASLFAVNIYFVSPNVLSIPLRLIFTVACFIFLISISQKSLLYSWNYSKKLILMVAYLAFVGAILSLINHNSEDLLQALVGNYFQAILILLTAFMGTLVIGRRLMTSAFIAPIALSAVFSVLQALNVGFATQVRGYLGEFYFNNVAEELVMADRNPGLSYSAIIFGNQVCLAFALAIYGLLINSQEISKRTQISSVLPPRYLSVIGASLLFMVVSVVAGNRSPLLGLAVFLCIFFFSGNRRMLIVSIGLLLVGYFYLNEIRDLLASSQLRVASVGDKSELIRYPLAVYGFRLFLANPLGYGATFDSKQLYGTVSTGDLISSSWGLGNIFGVLDLHNSWIIFLNSYGIFGVPVIIYCVSQLRHHWIKLIGFLPYLVHISFHNAAPLAKDYMFWVPVGIVLATTAMSRTSSKVSQAPAAPVRRAKRVVRPALQPPVYAHVRQMPDGNGEESGG